MDIDTLRGELERLFELEEMVNMSRDILGVSPDEVGETASKAAFSKALVERCIELDILDALLDAAEGLKPTFDHKARDAVERGMGEHEELSNGATFGPYTISRKVGQGPIGTVYIAKADGRQTVLKVFHPAAVRHRSAFARFATACRLTARIQHEGLPTGLLVDGAEGLSYVAYDWVEAQSVAMRTIRSGPMHINEARAILHSALEVVAALHDERQTHGNIKLENLLLARSTEPGKNRVLLVDPACDRLRVLQGRTSWANDLFVVLGDAETVAPEQVRGERVDPRADVYSFGVIMYEILTGKRLYPARSGLEFALAHLTMTPDPPNAAAPRGWVSKQVSDFVLSLLDRDPAARPKNAREVLDVFENLGRAAPSAKATPRVSDAELSGKIDALIVSPNDESAAEALDGLVEIGANAGKVAEAFMMAADQLDGDAPEQLDARKSLLFRAARLQEANLKNPEETERIYAWIAELDPSDETALKALLAVRKQLGKFDEVIEMLLARIERTDDREERAPAMAEIGRIYAEHVKEPAQAVVAYAQAFVETPDNDTYADLIEQVSGGDTTVLGEAIGILAEATQGQMAVEQKNKVFLRLGHWYTKKLGRGDAALPCYQAVIATEPHHDGALEGMAALFRSQQQYTELGQVILRRADAASNATRAREFRYEAAELLETRLEQPAKARELYEQVIAGDPSHEKASDALLRLLEKDGDLKGIITLLERKAEDKRASEKAELLVRIAQRYEEIKEYSEAVKRYEAALSADAKNPEALAALDTIYSQSGHFRELLNNLDRQMAVASTPRQRITYLERSASIWEKEFLDHEQAAKALDLILEVDPAHLSALEGLARHFRALDRWDEVAQVYERELKITTDQSRRLELLLVLARVVSEHVADPARAMKVYEEAIEIDPHHAGALEALAGLREQAGDADAALKAIEALAEKASTPKEKAEHLIRAAKLLEGRSDRDGAIVRYKEALDANPREAGAAAALRTLYLDGGDAAAAIELLLRQVQLSETPVDKARLSAEAANLARERLKDDARAEALAKEALHHDKTQIQALALLGNLAVEGSRAVEALHHYDTVISRLDQLPTERAARILQRYIEALVETDDTERAIASAEQLIEMSEDEFESVRLASRVIFTHGDPKRAFQLYDDLLERFGNKLVGIDRAQALYRHGESARRAGDALTAVKSLSEATDMDPTAPEPLAALALVFESKKDWEEVIRIKNRRLDIATGDERVALLVAIGEMCETKLEDKTRAAKSYIAALEERPDDRKLLTRLMQLYSESKDWSKLVEIVIKLADFVQDKKQKAKYIHTAAMVTGEQLKDADRAIEMLDQVLELDPSLDKALETGIEMRERKGDFEGVEKLLKIRLERATDAEDRELALKTFDTLGELYQKKLGWTEDAIDAYEAAQVLEPDNKERNTLLADLYVSDPTQYLDKAVAAQRGLLTQDANRPEPYRLLRRLYTESKKADNAWCLCQALTVLNMADADEDRFYRRMRSDTAAPAKDRLTDDDWLKSLMHVDADPIITAILALLEPAVLATRADTLENLGYDPRYAIDLARHPYPMSQTIYYASGVLGMDAPPTFQNINDDGGISFLHAQLPSIVLGRAAFEVEVPQQAAAFIVARHLTYYRPGMYVRHLVPTGTGLKAWLFAAIKMNAPQFPISPDLEGPVAENTSALGVHLSGPTRERLASLVSKLIQSGGALDLKKWVAAVDLTADRTGLLVAHDLEVATDMVKVSDESVSPLSHRERLKELVLFSVSEGYFALRQRLGIAIDN